MVEVIVEKTRTCPLCEAGCGLTVGFKTEPDAPIAVDTPVLRVRGDADDVLSKGFLCPKGASLGHLHHDPDWLRTPMIKRGDSFESATWDEAFAAIADGLLPIIAEHGAQSVGVYLGNPNAHNLGGLLYNRVLLGALGTRNRFSASTVDQRPKEVSAGTMFGSVTVPVPDLDRTDFLVIMGANPLASNGSLCMAPDFGGRIAAIQARGGKVVVIDPRRTETAEKADEHLAIRPGGDAALLAAIAHHLFATDQVDLGHLGDHVAGLDELRAAVADSTPDRVAPMVGLDAAVITGLADDLAAAPTAAVYGRMGTCTQEFGSLASWLVDVVNALTGNLDSVGGAMFAKGATGQPSSKGAPGSGRGFRLGRGHSRVSSTPEALGEYPVTVLLEEIETPGEGQIRAMVTVGGNPVSSNPNSARVDAAMAAVDFMVSVDPYINETTRHADVILPPPTPLQKSHYDLALLNFAVHNVANYSPALVPLADTQLAEHEIILRFAALVGGVPVDGLAEAAATIDDQTAEGMARSMVRDEHGPLAGRDVAEVLADCGDRRGPERLLDLMLRGGPYGAGTAADLSMDVLEANPHGVDLGALEAGRIPDLLRTESGKVELMPEPIVADLPRLAEAVDAAAAQRADDEALLLIGRRHVRSNNSWMHNLRTLTKGRNRCTLQVHPDDADRIGLVDGKLAHITSRVGALTVACEVTDAVRAGVVSLPHGFGQGLDGVQLEIAAAYDGVNTNVLTDEYLRDEPTGNIALNGVPVTVTAG